MKRLILISISIFLITNIIYSQDIINETGKDGKFIVRDAEQREALIVKDGNVEIIGELKIETMAEGVDTDAMVVWDKNDKSLKVVPRVFSELSGLSKPLEIKIDGNVVRGNTNNQYILKSVLEEDPPLISNVTDQMIITNSGSANGVFGMAIESYRGNTGTEYGWVGDGSNGSADMTLFSTVGNARLRAYATGKAAELWDKTGQVVTVTGGQVGIGTTNPVVKLHVIGDLILEDASPYVNFYTGVTNKGSIGIWSDGNLNIVNKVAAGDVVVATNSLERMRITNDGMIGIGTTTPQGRLDIVGIDGALIVPRMTTTQRNSLSTVNGSIIYNTSTDQFNFYESGSWVIK